MRYASGVHARSQRVSCDEPHAQSALPPTACICASSLLLSVRGLLQQVYCYSQDALTVNVDRNPVSDRNSSQSARKPNRFYSRFRLLHVNDNHARRFKRDVLVLSSFPAKVAFTLDTEARGLLPFYANLVKLYTFTVLRQNALTFTLPPPYGRAATPLSKSIVSVIHLKLS